MCSFLTVDETSKDLTALKVLCLCLAKGEQSLSSVYEEYEVSKSETNGIYLHLMELEKRGVSLLFQMIARGGCESR